MFFKFTLICETVLANETLNNLDFTVDLRCLKIDKKIINVFISPIVLK